MTSTVHVEVSGLTGSGKSAVMGEIEIALKALGLKVEHGPDFQAEKNGTHADWQQALDLYQPTVVLTERNVSRQPPAREDAQPFGYWVEHRSGENPVLIRYGSFVPASDHYKITTLYSHPAPDALRDAMAAIRAEINAPLTGPTHGAWDRGRIAGLKEALAALQAEQKGGA
ncbi:hypothetical protein [Brevundimonas naejangsanensis]|uniref:hypothetical protein n=1 Tax=Brevundimonas naejangsanensis TaxID=588932 RepID=UPI00040A5D5F|nr:hypothetical protein [Brevundimonas naejangsanensis]